MATTFRVGDAVKMSKRFLDTLNRSDRRNESRRV